MAKKEGYVTITIPEDALNEWEKAKTVTVNGITYSIPVGEPVEVPEFVAEVVLRAIKNDKFFKEENRKRMEDLEKQFKN